MSATQLNVNGETDYDDSYTWRVRVRDNAGNYDSWSGYHNFRRAAINSLRVESYQVVTQVELGEIRELINGLRSKVKSEVDPEVKNAALESI